MAGAVSSSRNTNRCVKKLRREIRAVWPNDRVKFWVHAELAKKPRIAQRQKYFAIQLPGKVNFAFHAVGESQAERVVSNKCEGISPEVLHEPLPTALLHRAAIGRTRD